MAVFKKPAALKAGSDEEIPNKPNKLANKKVSIFVCVK